MKNTSRGKMWKRNWSDLNGDLLDYIARKLEFVKDLIAFRSVCVSWRSAAAIKGERRQLPWLLEAKQAGNVIKLYDNGKLYETINLSPEIKNWCLGWKGWVLVFDKKGNMYLSYIFDPTIIILPSKTTLQDSKYRRITIHKAALSSNPFTNMYDYTLMIMYSYDGQAFLAFWRSGDKSYTKIQINDTVCDVLFHKGFWYAITSLGELMVLDITKPTTTRQIVGKMPNPYSHYFLVELGGGLSVVGRSFHIISPNDYNLATRFHVFLFSESAEWREIKDLGNKTIFIGLNTSFSIDNASEIPGCMPNHIYFTDDYRTFQRHHNHVGVYNLTNGIVGDSQFGGREEPCQCSHPPLWIQPTFLQLAAFRS